MKITKVLIDEHQLSIAVRLGMELTGTTDSFENIFDTVKRTILNVGRRHYTDPFEFHSSGVGVRILLTFVKVFDRENRGYLDDTVRANISVLPEDRDPLTADSWETTSYTL